MNESEMNMLGVSALSLCLVYNSMVLLQLEGKILLI